MRIFKASILVLLVSASTGCTMSPSREPIVTQFNGDSVSIMYPVVFNNINSLDFKLVENKAQGICNRGSAGSTPLYVSQVYSAPNYNSGKTGKIDFLFLCLKPEKT